MADTTVRSSSPFIPAPGRATDDEPFGFINPQGVQSPTDVASAPIAGRGSLAARRGGPTSPTPTTKELNNVDKVLESIARSQGMVLAPPVSESDILLIVQLDRAIQRVKNSVPGTVGMPTLGRLGFQASVGPSKWLSNSAGYQMKEELVRAVTRFEVARMRYEQVLPHWNANPDLRTTGRAKNAEDTKTLSIVNSFGKAELDLRQARDKLRKVIKSLGELGKTIRGNGVGQND